MIRLKIDINAKFVGVHAPHADPIKLSQTSRVPHCGRCVIGDRHERAPELRGARRPAYLPSMNSL